MKVLVTGAGGQLGREFAENSAVRLSSGEFDIIPLGRKELDITDIEAARSTMKKYSPDAVIICAAMTNVDMCETAPEKAYRINAEGARLICTAAAEAGADFVQLSTDFVFDGKGTSPYSEEDSCSPINIYGRSKLMSEEYVRSITHKHYIVRTSWLYGRYGSNFVTAIQNKARRDGSLKVVSDQTGCPTCTEELMRYILLLIKSGRYGTYHVSGKGCCTKYEFACHIVSQAGIEAQVSHCLTSDYPSPAARPTYSVLDISKAEKVTGLSSPDWKTVFDNYYRI